MSAERPSGQATRGQFQVHVGLAAAGDAEEQPGLGPARVQGGKQLLQGRGLLRGAHPARGAGLAESARPARRVGSVGSLGIRVIGREAVRLGPVPGQGRVLVQGAEMHQPVAGEGVQDGRRARPQGRDHPLPGLGSALQQQFQHGQLAQGPGPHPPGRVRGQAHAVLGGIRELGAHHHAAHGKEPGQPVLLRLGQGGQLAGGQSGPALFPGHAEPDLGRAQAKGEQGFQDAAHRDHLAGRKLPGQGQVVGVQQGPGLQRPEHGLQRHALGRGHVKGRDQPQAQGPAHGHEHPLAHGQVREARGLEVGQGGEGRAGQEDLAAGWSALGIRRNLRGRDFGGGNFRGRGVGHGCLPASSLAAPWATCIPPRGDSADKERKPRKYIIFLVFRVSGRWRRDAAGQPARA